MAKIIGFMERVDGYRTAAGKSNHNLFVNACEKAAEVLDMPVDKLATKRQASKFFRGTGIVFNTVCKS